MKVIYNPTNESIKMMFSGIDVTLQPEEKKKVEDACANHLLNSHGQRGLCALEYGDEANESRIAEQGRERNKEFWKSQIARYNAMNEQRKMQGLGYLKPGQELRQHSLDLSIQLLEPYTLKDEEKGLMTVLKRENEELREQIKQLAESMKVFMAPKLSEEIEKRGPGRPPSR